MRTEEIQESVNNQVRQLEALLTSGKMSRHQLIPMVQEVMYWGNHYLAFDTPPPEVTFH
jgi:hypothetical protein